MSMRSRHPAPSDAHDTVALTAMMARVQKQLSSRSPRIAERRCALCGETIRGGQVSTTVHGTAVHACCRSASSATL